MDSEKRSFVHRTDPQSKGLIKKLFGAFFSSSANTARDPDHFYPSNVIHTNVVDRGKMEERTIRLIEKELLEARDECEDVELHLQEVRDEVVECERELVMAQKAIKALEVELAVAKRIGTEMEKVA